MRDSKNWRDLWRRDDRGSQRKGVGSRTCCTMSVKRLDATAAKTSSARVTGTARCPVDKRETNVSSLFSNFVRKGAPLLAMIAHSVVQACTPTLLTILFRS